jgi:hypothetical protein
MDQQSALEEIALIRRVMDESRRFAFDNGKYYLTWGIIITVAIFAQYAVLLTNRESVSGWIWMIAVGLGWLISIVMGMREPSKPAGWPVGAKLIGLIWVSSGVSMMIFGFIGPMTGALHSWAICPAIATVMGGAYTISSLVYRMKWVTMVGIAWWVGALIMFAVKGIETLPIFGTMMILFQIVPAIVFYRTWKSNSKAAALK